MEPEQLECATESVNGVDTRSCPFCAETIRAAATKCRHCKEMLVSKAESAPSVVARVESHAQPQILSPTLTKRKGGLLATLTTRQLAIVLSVGVLVWYLVPMPSGMDFCAAVFFSLVLLDLCKRALITSIVLGGCELKLMAFTGVSVKRGSLKLLGNGTWEDCGSQGRRSYSTIEIGNHELRGLIATDYLSTHLSNACGAEAEIYTFLGRYIIGLRYNNRMYSDMSVLLRYFFGSAVAVLCYGVGVLFLAMALGASLVISGERER